MICLRCLLHHILSLIIYTFRENREFVFIIIFVLVCRSYSFVCTAHHLIIIIVQTYLKALNLQNACQIYFVECVSKIKNILSVIHYTICGAICFQFTPFSCDDCENIYTVSYYHHQIGSMNYYPLFRVRSWNNGVHCMSFYILIDITILLLVLKAASEEHSVIKMLYGDIDFCLPTPVLYRISTKANIQWPLLLTWFNFNPSMDK